MGTLVSMPTSPRPDDQTRVVGRRLASTRLALGFTQEELAEQLGVSRGALANWETGSRLPDVLAMVRLSERHSVPLDWIYQGNPARLPHDLASQLLPGNGNSHPSQGRRRAV